MLTLRLLLPTGRALVALDVALAAWVGFWIWLGVAVGSEVRGLRQLSDTATTVGVAVKQTGDTLSGLGSLPFVGGAIAREGQTVSDAGQSTIDSGRTSRDSAHQLSWMLALAIAVIPSMPVLGFYVPLRVLDRRERSRLRRLAELRWDDPGFRRFLARRALTTMPYHRLPVDGTDPWLEEDGDRVDQLADAELQRLGVERPAR
jgi:hypothetical protein